MSKGAPLLRPLGLSFAAKRPSVPKVRPPQAGEVRVIILSASGVFLQEKLGVLSGNGTRCSVRYEGEYRQAQFVDGHWEYRLQSPPEDP